MKRQASAPLLVVLALGLSSCGDYNPEDLLFRRAAPRPEDVALRPPGAEIPASENQVQQGVSSCDEAGRGAQLRCLAQGIATGLNGMTLGVLKTVDDVLRHPPTERSRGRRVWGPHFVAEERASFRFEMVRREEGGFAFCIHVAPRRIGAFARPEMTCEDAEHPSGLIRVLSGTLLPGSIEGEEARSGSGIVLLDLDRFARLTGNRDAGGTFEIAFDNRGGERRIDIALRDIRLPRFPSEADYSYERNADGSGCFRFSAKVPFYDPLGMGDELEDATIEALWDEDRAGRAEALFTGGDLDDFEIRATECWDAELCRVFYDDGNEEHREGEESACVFGALELE